MTTPRDADIEVHRPSAPAFLPGEHETGRIWKLAERIAQTDFVPRSLRGNPPAIMAAMLTGRELGIMPMRALRQVNIIEGQPSPSPELMMALALKAGHDVDVVETSRTRCVVEVHRGSWPDDKVRRLEWTIDDAEAAGLCEITDDGKVRARSNKGNPLPWETYTRAMLRSRAVSEACRTWLPDVVDGASYVPEELGGTVTAEGHATELVDAAQARGEAYDPLEGESDEVRTQVADAMASDADVVDAEIVDEGDSSTARPEDGGEPAAEAAEGPPPADNGGPSDEEEPDAPGPGKPADPGEGDSTPAPSPQGSRAFDPFYDWTDHADKVEVTKVELLTTLRDAWPKHDMFRQPKHSKDIDALATADDTQFVVRETIDDIAESR